MDVTIGIQNVARELSIETDSDAAGVAAAVEQALAGDGVLRLTDTKGREVLVPGRAIGWIQVGESEKGKVGFGAV
ncbi:MAG: DUF3107 domain-containing protein [Phycicoccus sp.]